MGRFYIRSYVGENHQAVKDNHAKVGDFLMETWHEGKVSLAMETGVYADRMMRGEVQRFEVRYG